MTFSAQKRTLLKDRKELKLFTFLLGLGCAALLFVPYMAATEGYFTFYGDFNVQQIPFYKLAHEAVRSGNFGWNWYTDLGANFIGSYSFYLLGSPFFWLTIPFPTSFVPYLMGPLLILKFGLAALTAYLFIRRFTRTAQAASLGAILYAFSGFSIYNIFYNHFHEAIIVFPLLLLAVELLITENKRGLFAIMVAVCAVVNYFFFFGMVLFCVIYFFVRLFSGAIKPKFSRFLTLIFEAVVGLLISAVLLLPSLSAIMDNPRIDNTLYGWGAILYGREQLHLNIFEIFFFPPDIPARPVFFPGSEVRWSSLGGWLPVFSMAGVIAFCSERKGHWLKRMICISAFMASVPVLNSAFHAFNNCYYARWFYMPILLMCLMTAYIYEDNTLSIKTGFRWNVGITVATVAVIGFFPAKDDEDNWIFGLYSRENELSSIARFAISCAIAVLCLMLLKIIINLRQKQSKKLFAVTMAFVCSISVIYGNVFIFSGRLHSFDIKEVVVDSLIEQKVNLPEGNYRIDTYDCPDNTAMYLGHSSINAFHSVVPGSIMDFYHGLGIERSVGSRPDTDYVALRPFLSVKYLVNRVSGDSFTDESGEPIMSGFKYLKTEGGYYIYENENYIPYGFCYDYYMSEEEFDCYGGTAKARMLLKAMLLNKGQIKKYSSYFADISTLDVEDIYADSPDYLTLSLSNEALKNDSARLRNNACYYFEKTDSGFKSEINRDKKSLVFFSVPYEEGWSATVNGKKVEVEKVNFGFMAVPVDEGISEIEFTYETPNLVLGALITAFALFVFVVYMLIFIFYRKKHTAQNRYPEGDALLAHWRKLDESKKNDLPPPEAVSIFDLLDKPIKEEKPSDFDGGFDINLEDFE